MGTVICELHHRTVTKHIQTVGCNQIARKLAAAPVELVYFQLVEAAAMVEHMGEKADEFEQGIVGCENEGIEVLEEIAWQIRYSKRKADPG